MIGSRVRWFVKGQIFLFISVRKRFVIKYWVKTLDALKISMFKYQSYSEFVVNYVLITTRAPEYQTKRATTNVNDWTIFFAVSNYLCCTYPIPSNILLNSSLNSCNHFAGHSLWQRTQRNVDSETSCLWTALENYSYSPYFDNSFRFFVATYVINLLIVHFHYIVTSIDYSSIISEWCSFKKNTHISVAKYPSWHKSLWCFYQNRNIVWNISKNDMIWPNKLF